MIRQIYLENMQVASVNHTPRGHTEDAKGLEQMEYTEHFAATSSKCVPASAVLCSLLGILAQKGILVIQREFRVMKVTSLGNFHF